MRLSSVFVAGFIGSLMMSASVIPGVLKGAASVSASESAEASSSSAAAHQGEAKKMLATLSLEEKITLLTGIGFSLGEPLPGTDNYIPGVAGYTRAMPQHGLPSMLLADGPAGLRFAEPAPGEAPERVATAFPIASAVASSWDMDLASEMGAAMGREARAYGIDIILAPGMNLQRDPLGGRNYEYYSEDPILSGRVAAAAVRGIQSTGVGATIKHFVANNQETNRTALDTIVDEKTLRELYLRGFEIAVKESKPAAIMTAYNLLNGTHTSESKRLNTDILRGEWGFDGIVMTDWFAGTNPAQQIRAGHNLLMPGMDADRASIQKAVDDGSLTEAAIDQALTPTLEAIYRTSKLAIEPFDAQAHAAIARRVAAEGIVLLKNDKNTLPLTKPEVKTALFGVGAYDTVSGGTGSGDVAESYTVSIAQGLEAAGFTLDVSVSEPVKKHIAAFNANLKPRQSIFDPKPRVQDIAMDKAVIERAAKTNDTAIITISRLAGEFADRPIEGDFTLTETERDLIKHVSEAFRRQNKPVIAVLNVAGPIDVASWEDQIDVLLVAWMGGQEAGSALADVVTAKVQPSGRLPQTWHRAYADTSTAAFFPGKPTGASAIPAYAGFAQALPSRVTYGEKGNVGYRAYKAGSDRIAYPFGHGLSYTQFSMAKIDADLTEDGVTLTATINNVGDQPGKSVLQIYVSSAASPTPELKAFDKTALIAAGKSVQLSTIIPLRDLAHFDAERGDWVLAAGAYEISFGFSSQDIRARHGIRIAKEIRFAP